MDGYSAPSVVETDVFRAPVVAALAGITYRQLDYWARTDVLTPSVSEAKGSGSTRVYSTTDVRILRAFRSLIANGASLSMLRRHRVPELLRTLAPEDWGGLLVITHCRALVTSDPAELVRALAHDGGGVAQLLDLAATALTADDLAMKVG